MTPDPIRILLIEDNPADATLVERYLGQSSQESEFRVEWANRVADGRNRLRQGGHDLVLLDLSLPDSDGAETYETVLSDAGTVPVVVMTGQNDSDQALRAVREGAQDYLVKDRVDADILVRSIRYAIERKRVEEQLRISEERYSLAVTGAKDGVWDWDLRTESIYFSDRWKSMLGWDPEDIGEEIDAWLSRVHPGDLPALKQRLSDHLSGATPHFESEHRILEKGGTYRWVLARGLAVSDDSGRVTRVAGSLTDIHDRKMTEEQLLHDAMHDGLTQLPNSALFQDRLQVAIAQAERRPNYLFAVLFFDLDRFKVINDSLGHSVGDRLLVAIARRLLSFLRPGDTVARLGGDEFAILANDIDDPSDATRIAERIQEELSRPFDLGGHEVFTGASIGIAMSSSGYKSPQEVLRDADIAMYRAKSHGGKHHAVFDLSMHQRAVELLQLETDLRRAVAGGEFVTHYQPIVDLNGGRIKGFEALVRWRHPERGLVYPKEFISVAEETGMIVPLGWSVIREACKQMSKWREGAPEQDLALSVNLSPRQFAQPDLIDRLLEVLQETGMDPSKLRLEIIESLIMDDAESAIAKLGKLRDLGLQLHLDDFGTGYSSLSYLHKLPTHTVKIDRSFVKRMSGAEGRDEIIETIVSLARGLGMHVAAEGLETPHQFRKLRQLECEYGQGYYFSRPLDGEQAQLLIDQKPRWRLSARS
ncbi:MAG: EAL domain-containing protein [bacterium]|nr:EAL domain-containing protein [bacterium]